MVVHAVMEACLGLVVARRCWSEAVPIGMLDYILASTLGAEGLMSGWSDLALCFLYADLVLLPCCLLLDVMAWMILFPTGFPLVSILFSSLCFVALPYYLVLRACRRWLFLLIVSMSRCGLTDYLPRALIFELQQIQLMLQQTEVGMQWTPSWLGYFILLLVSCCLDGAPIYLEVQHLKAGCKFGIDGPGDEMWLSLIYHPDWISWNLWFPISAVAMLLIGLQCWNVDPGAWSLMMDVSPFALADRVVAAVAMLGNAWLLKAD
ncbi:hypothetical protein Nepgr_005356 [Nepenthes gracilis]|uniref:Uncharacterized protein n=1 Tax=Nepenthes gracilis TaxID=150966 RepID=A0AAD3S311_NEPGR|nr:hypothetical protein Nepgr_005356 [Nepenthes gracilis]